MLPTSNKTLYNFAEIFSCGSVGRDFGALIAFECQKSSGEPADECLQVNVSEAEEIHPKASYRTPEGRGKGTAFKLFLCMQRKPQVELSPLLRYR